MVGPRTAASGGPAATERAAASERPVALMRSVTLERPVARNRPVAVVTGANSGVGFETTRRLAGAAWVVVMLCRDAERAGEARRRLADDTGSDALLEVELVDLADLGEVEDVAARVLARHRRLAGLVLNAGVYEPTCRRTDDGFERTLAINHLAHALLTLRLLPALVERADRSGHPEAPTREGAAGVSAGDVAPNRGSPARIVSVSSNGHRRRGDLLRAPLEAILRGEAWRGGLGAYADSKLANVLWARELDRRLRHRGVRADAVHPGVLATRIWERPTGVKGLLARTARLFMDPADVGGEAVARLLLDPDLARGGGRYFDETVETEPSDQARDADLAARLWDTSLSLLDAEDPTGPAASERGDPGGA